jgi:hypothetical protein
VGCRQLLPWDYFRLARYPDTNMHFSGITLHKWTGRHEAKFLKRVGCAHVGCLSSGACVPRNPDSLICRRKRKKNLCSLTELTRTNAFSDRRPLQPARPNLGIALIGEGPCVAEDWQSGGRVSLHRVGDPPRQRAFNPSDRDVLSPARQGLVPSLPAQNTGWPR